MRINRPPLAVPFYKDLEAKSSMSEPSREPVQFIFTVTDDGKKSTWLDEVRSIPAPTFSGYQH